MINNTDIEKLQKLAKLRYSKEQTDVLQNNLNNIVAMLDELQEIDCANVEPLRSVIDGYQRMVEDVVDNKLTTDELFQNVPEAEANLAKEVSCFLVPKVVE